MRKYRFRLNSVLKLRLYERQQRQQQLLEAQHAVQLIDEQIQRTQAEIESLKQDARRLTSPGVIHVDELLTRNRYEVLQRTHLAVLHQQRSKLMEEVQRRRQALVEADRLVRTLEKLRDNQLAEHQHREFLDEMKGIDEVAQRVFSRPGLFGDDDSPIRDEGGP